MLEAPQEGGAGAETHKFGLGLLNELMREGLPRAPALTRCVALLTITIHDRDAPHARPTFVIYVCDNSIKNIYLFPVKQEHSFMA